MTEGTEAFPSSLGITGKANLKLYGSGFAKSENRKFLESIP